MGAGSLQAELVLKSFVDEQPIRLDMTISVANPMPAKLMIPALWRKSLSCEEKVNDGFHLGEVFTALEQTPDISLELICL